MIFYELWLHVIHIHIINHVMDVIHSHYQLDQPPFSWPSFSEVLAHPERWGGCERHGFEQRGRGGHCGEASEPQGAWKTRWIFSQGTEFSDVVWTFCVEIWILSCLIGWNYGGHMVFLDEIGGISGSKMDDWSLYTDLQVDYVHILERIWSQIFDPKNHHKMAVSWTPLQLWRVHPNSSWPWDYHRGFHKGNIKQPDLSPIPTRWRAIRGALWGWTSPRPTTPPSWALRQWRTSPRPSGCWRLWRTSWCWTCRVPTPRRGRPLRRRSGGFIIPVCGYWAKNH